MIPRTVQIRRGDLVECVDDTPHNGRTQILSKGRVYEIEAAWGYLPHRSNPEWQDCAVDLVGVPCPEEDIAWGLYRFRPFGERA